jgi:serine O-acetyltransferase
MFENLRADIDRWRQEDVQQGWWTRYRWINTMRHLLAMGMAPVILYRFEHWVYKRVHIPVVRQSLQVFGILMRRFVGMWTGVYIHPRAEIGPGFEVHSFYGVLIGITKIGKNFTVGSGVLVNCGAGGIGDNVYMGPGAKIIGDAKVGNNVVIMPNSVVITDVPDNTTIAGVPARIKLRGGRPRHLFPEGGKAQAQPRVSAAPKLSRVQPAQTPAGRLEGPDSRPNGDGRSPEAKELERQPQR